MASLNEIADSILGRLDRRFDDIFRDEVKFAVKFWRAEFIRRDIERNQENSLYLQALVVPLIKVDKYDPCAKIVDCPVLRTKNTIPLPIRLKDNRNFKFVGELGRRKSFTPCEMEDLEYSKHNKWTANAVRYTYMNGYLYVFNNLLYKFMLIEAAFANPEDANQACDGECYSDDMEFPLPLDMIRAISDGIVNGSLQIKPKDLEVKHEGK